MKQHNLLSIKNVVLMGMFGALSAVLMLFDFPIPFIAPSFYTLDLSEIPVLIGTFSLGPVAGAVAGTMIMAVVGAVLNALVMLPFYSNFMPLDTIIAAGAAINPAICNVWTFVFLAVAPFNLVKGFIVSLITALIYKRVSIIIHAVR